MTRWHLSHRYDPRALPLANRHYSRQSPDAPQFIAPGRYVALLTADASALWVSLWQRAEFTDHAWPGAWSCSLFRNENGERDLSSELIVEAVAATRAQWGDPPALGMVTFVDARKTRAKRDPGRCFRRAGFVEVGRTGSGLVVLQLPPDAMPPPRHAHGAQLALAGAA